MLVASVNAVGKHITLVFSSLGFASIIFFQSFQLIFFGRSFGQPVRLRHVVSKIYMSGIQGLPVVVLMSATIGIMLSVQGIHSLAVFGAETQVVFGLALSIPREFAPLITGILVAGRSGSQLTSQVGSMRLNGELDALTVIGISPTRFIIAPSIISLMISLPILVAVSIVSAFSAAGIYINISLGIGSVAYLSDLLSVVNISDLFHSFGKAIIFSILISVIAVSKGLTVSGGAEMLGRNTTSSVVACISAIIIADTVFALVL